MATEKNWVSDLIAAQRACKAIQKDAVNPHFKSKYATLDAIRAAVVEACWDNGFAITQIGVVRDDGLPVLRTTLHHTGGHEVVSDLPLVATNKPQELGSNITYARRYGLAAILNVVAEEDDDGNAASSRPSAPASDEDPEKKKLLAKMWKELDKLGDEKPWEDPRKRRVLEETFGTTHIQTIKAKDKGEIYLALKEKFVPALKAAMESLAGEEGGEVRDEPLPF